MVHRNQEKHHQKIANPCQHSQITEYEYTVGAETVILTKCVIFLTKTGANDVIKKIQPACRCSFGPLGVTLVPHMSTRPPTFLPTYTFRLLQLSVLDHLICFSSAVRVFFFKTQCQLQRTRSTIYAGPMSTAVCRGRKCGFNQRAGQPPPLEFHSISVPSEEKGRGA